MSGSIHCVIFTPTVVDTIVSRAYVHWYYRTSGTYSIECESIVDNEDETGPINPTPTQDGDASRPPRADSSRRRAMARGGDERARVGIVRRGVSLFARAKHRGGGRRLGRTVARETRSSRDDDADDDADDEDEDATRGDAVRLVARRVRRARRDERACLLYTSPSPRD